MRFGRKGGWWDQEQQFLRTNALWTYDGFGQRDAPLEASVALDNSVVLRGGWRVSLTPELQAVAFDTRRYATYATVVARSGSSVDTVAVRPADRQYTVGVQGSVNTPQWRRLGVAVSGRYGTEPEFFETATARRTDLEVSADMRTTPKWRSSALLRYQRFVRERDGSAFSTQVVPRLRTEYQFSRALFQKRMPPIVRVCGVGCDGRSLRSRRHVRSFRVKRRIRLKAGSDK